MFYLIRVNIERTIPQRFLCVLPKNNDSAVIRYRIEYRMQGQVVVQFLLLFPPFAFWCELISENS